MTSSGHETDLIDEHLLWAPYVPETGTQRAQIVRGRPCHG